MSTIAINRVGETIVNGYIRCGRENHDSYKTAVSKAQTGLVPVAKTFENFNFKQCCEISKLSV
ncbi:hypothetical protein [Caldicellulosiruptor owensensis]|uniref:hypothetical protein n=1 Tax=Caldicellulosiruptor owensensis TaxID=55205 RepID=UPI00059FB418|nr:hypothetical protein [Caldicellulosiruptor owensensis]